MSISKKTAVLERLSPNPRPLKWHLALHPSDFNQSAPILLITNHSAMWRFRERFAQAGINLLDPGDAYELELGSALQRIDPQLTAVALRDPGRHISPILAFMTTHGLLGACLFHTGNGRWLRGKHPQLLTHIDDTAGKPSDPRGDLAAMIAFARLMQILKPNWICVDVVDILACLGLSRCDCDIVIGTFRLPRDPKQMEGSIRHWMRKQDVAAPWNCVLCIETAHVQSIRTLFDQCAIALHRELRDDAFVVPGPHLRTSTATRCTMALLSSREPSDCSPTA